ncbi:MAG: GGDEF domain-containing protein [Thermoleophilia bacterium]|nr:GGDEF domain-containing protein [Thermoleophilia bacterium]
MLVAFWLASRRPVDVRIATALDRVDDRLVGLAERIEAASVRPIASNSRLDTIGSTIELDEVLHRTLAAAGALPAVDGSSIRVERANGEIETAIQGHVRPESAPFLTGPPDGAAFASGMTSWDVEGPGTLRTGLVVPIGPEGRGSLAVYSRKANAFDQESVTLLAAIARHAAPAIQNAFRFLDVQELAATDLRTGLRSALAFSEELPREVSAARRHGRPLCMIQVDLDNFGLINKTFSQETGDAVLAEFGARIRATIRGGDAAYRNSGGADEFFVILPDTTRELAKRFYGRLAFEIAERPFGEAGALTMSGGLVELGPEDTVESLTARTGALVTKAKQAGKNQLADDGTS